jgi:4-alpha-glucanotransferase
MRRHGLGRFRVTQKADPENPRDVYRTDEAQPEDWVLLGNHDTPTIWSKIVEWRESGDVRAQADYLAERLSTRETERWELARRFRESEFELAHAKLAELFACNARNVVIAFADLFGFVEPYNRPGTFSDHNWSLRLPRDFESNYRAAVERRRALWLPKALELALRRTRPDHPLNASAPRLA